MSELPPDMVIAGVLMPARSLRRLQLYAEFTGKDKTFLPKFLGCAAAAKITEFFEDPEILAELEVTERARLQTERNKVITFPGRYDPAIDRDDGGPSEQQNDHPLGTVSFLRDYVPRVTAPLQQHRFEINPNGDDWPPNDAA